MEMKQWQYGMDIFFGILVFSMPWLLGFENTLPLRSWDFFVMGVATVGFGALALHKRSRAGAWATVILGAWMFASPWVLGFDGNEAARNSALALGALTFLYSLWAKLERMRFERLSTRGHGSAA
jgi:hypothetical protein